MTDLLAWIFLAACPQSPLETAKGQRGMTVEDLLSVENLGSIALSPDGRWAAVAIQRSKREAGLFTRTRLGGDDRSDLWLVATSTGERRRLTDGAADGSGTWAPAWSPDGERLAMLTSQGGDQARLLVWSRSTETLERVVEEGIHLGAPLATGDARGYGFAWLDETRILAVLVPPDFRPFDFGGDHETQLLAPRAWTRMQRGLEPSVSVLVSGAPPPPAGVATVAILDVAGRRSTPLAEVEAALLSAPQASLAPDGRHLAVLETGPRPPPAPGRPMTFDERGRTRVGLVRVGPGRDSPRWLEGIERASLDTIAWSPDGKSLAALAPRRGEGSDDAVHRIDAQSGERRSASPPGWKVTRLLWLDSERLVVQASADAQRPGPRSDWWLLPPGGEPRNLTAAIPEPPSAVTRGPDGILLAVAGGDLWRIDPASAPSNLTASFAPTVRSLARRQGPPGKRDLPEVVIDAGEEGATSPYRVSLEEGPHPIESVSAPSSHATVDAHWPSQRAVVFRAVEDDGVFAWATDLSSGRTTRLAAINEHLADVAPARQRLVEYRGADGDPLNALVLLPHDYQEGKRYPVLTWVYAGDVVRKIRRRPPLADKFSENTLNLLPLLARGYVVLLPSIPLPPEGKPADPMIELPKGVIPAVDRLIELGIADPDRLAVGGHSYGGYSAYAMIATTNRFKAAIASAGTSDLVSQYGTLDARFRYGETATEGDSERRWAEGGQGRMGVPPYENLWRYLRNSPIHFVDRVQTPVLIIQGDMDFVPLAQGEEFFLGLHRQGKSARFLRYFGEGHTVESPANVRHMWGEIFAWLDTHLGPPDRPPSPK